MGLEVIAFGRWIEEEMRNVVGNGTLHAVGEISDGGWILEVISVEGSFMGVGVNLRPRLRSSSSSLVMCSLDMLTTVVFFFEWGLVSLKGPAIDGEIDLGVMFNILLNIITRWFNA